MKKSMKISLWLTSIGLGFLVFSFAICAANAFKLSFSSYIGGVFSASLFTLIFGGSWNLSGTRTGGPEMTGSPLLIVAFCCMVLALFIFIFIIYGMTCDNINYKHRFICGIVAVILLLTSIIILFFTKSFVADAYIKYKSAFRREDIMKNTTIDVGVYIVISFLFVSMACYIAAAINSLIDKKIHK